MELRELNLIFVEFASFICWTYI